jgi:hypothetical protein
MNQIKSDLPMQPPRYKIDTNLPKPVVGAQSSLPFLPETDPPWEVEIHPVHMGQTLVTELLFDPLTIPGSS